MVVKILRLPSVEAQVGLGRSTIYKRVREGTFPPPVNLGDRAVGWIQAEISEWLAERVLESRREKCPIGTPVLPCGPPLPQQARQEEAAPLCRKPRSRHPAQSRDHGGPLLEAGTGVELDPQAGAGDGGHRRHRAGHES